MSLELKGNNVVDTKTGEVICDIRPKFKGWKYENYLAEYNKDKSLRFLEPMTAQELEGEDTKKYLEENLCVAEQKFDGHRALNSLTRLGNRLFSRRVSKQTGWFAENTDQLPHIRDIIVPPKYYGTVLDNEALLPVNDCSCRELQSVMGALPETAINNQLESGFAFLNCFDILYYCGLNVQAMPYWKRKLYEFKVIKEIASPYLKFTEIYATKPVMDAICLLWSQNKLFDPDILRHIHLVESYDELFTDFLALGREGLILKNIHSKYEQKRSKSFIKMKAHQTYDVVIMGYEDPTHYYEGKALKDPNVSHDWWEDAEDDGLIVNELLTMEEAEGRGLLAVTKFYAMDWIGAIKFGVWKERQLQYFIDICGDLETAKKYIKGGIRVGVIREGDKHHWELVEVGQTSGLDEATRKDISENEAKYIGKVIEVEAQHIINKETGSLQHPRFIQFRPDKNVENCTFDEHIRKYGEDK